MAERKKTWSGIEEERGYVSPPVRDSLDERIEARRNDSEFMDRLKAFMKRDREILDRLGD